MAADYVYKRKDGGTTLCYGECRWDSNFDIVCEDGLLDGIWACNDSDVNDTWHKVCAHLEEHYNDKIEQLEAV